MFKVFFCFFLKAFHLSLNGYVILCKERRNLTLQGTMYTLVSHVVSFALVIKCNQGSLKQVKKGSGFLVFYFICISVDDVLHLLVNILR